MPQRGFSLIDVNVEDAGPCKKLLKIRVPQDDIKAKLEESYETLCESVNVPGFRKGHAPRKLLEKRFGEQVIEELKQTVMADASTEALEKSELKPLGEPSFDSADFDADQDFTFDMTVEVQPEFDMPEYKGLELTKISTEVTDEEIAEGTKALLRRLASLEPVKDGVVQMGDALTCDWEIVVDNDVALSNKDDQVEVREGLFAPVGAADVASKLVGARQGDTVDVSATFPEDYPMEKYQGKDGEVRVSIKKVARPNLPELTDEIAQKLDFEDADELREEVGSQLTSRKAQQQREDLERQVEEAMLAKARFELPEGLLKRQSQSNLDRQQMRLRMRGMNDADIAKRMDELRAASEEAAERDFRLYFIMTAIAESEKLFVTENEVENAIARLAAAYRVAANKMRQDLEANERISDLRQQMRTDKVMSFLIDNATVKDAS